MSDATITNEADGELVRAVREDDGRIVVTVAECDADGHADDLYGWRTIAIREPDGTLSEGDPESWTEARAATVNDCLRMI